MIKDYLKRANHSKTLVIVSQPGGHGNEVKVEGLWDEWEWPWDPEIALDDFQLVVFGYELHVEGAGHA